MGKLKVFIFEELHWIKKGQKLKRGIFGGNGGKKIPIVNCNA